jgi:ribonucleoside-diphosphate reductase alpha chain
MRGDTATPPEPSAEAEQPANGTNGQANGGNGGNGGGKGSPARPAGGRAAGSRPSDPKPPTSALTDEPPAIPAKLQGLELGPACAQCGGMMQRTGSCYTCSSCGNNTGCG